MQLVLMSWFGEIYPDIHTATAPSPINNLEQPTMAQTPITMTCDQLTELLKPVLQQSIKAVQAGNKDQPGSSRQLGEDHTEQLLAGLQQHLAAYIQGSQSIQAKGVPLPEVDEQLLPLQQQVEAVMQSVAAHRASVPAVISKALEQQLQDMRPPGCTATAAAAEAGAGEDDALAPTDQAAAVGAADSTAEVAQAQQLQEALKAALNKLPALRARLEEMDVRLQRNLEAVDAAHANADQAPRTVERVLRSAAAVGGGAAAAAAGGKGRKAAAAAAASQDD